MRHFVISALLCCSLLSSPALAGDGALQWRTIETAHFRVHFPEKLKHFAMMAAQYCEDAYTTLTPIFGYGPSQLVEVTISDYGDLSNGSATAIPHPRMTLYAAPPRLDESLGDHDSWLRLLIFHEFTHVLQLDQISGVPFWINSVFGRSMSPNQNLPPFLLEGGAVWAESHTTNERGRIHSSLFRGYLRAQALDERLHGLDAMTHVPGEWPDANIWYLYGGHFIDWVIRRHGQSWLKVFHTDIGDDLLPFGINRAMKRAVGETWHGMYSHWVEDLKRHAETQREALKRLGLSQPAWLTRKGRTHNQLRYLPDGSLIVYESGRRKAGLYRYFPDKPGVASQPFFIEEGLVDYDLCPGGQRVLFTRPTLSEGTYRYNDLFEWDRTNNAVRRITMGGRVREPSCSPDGRSVVASRVRNGGVDLVEIELQSRAITTVISAAPLEQYAMPIFTPNGRSIISVRASPNAQRDLVLIRRDTGQLSRLSNSDALELNPRFSPDGSRLLFAADDDGVFNIYAMKWPSGIRQRLTRVLTGATEAAQSPIDDNIAISVVTADGFDVGTLPVQATPAGPMSVSSTPAVSPNPPALLDRGYQPGGYLWPTTWSPSFAFTNAEGDSGELGLEVESSDPLGHHSLSGTVSSLATERALTASLQYAYRRYAPTVSASAFHSEFTRPNAATYGLETHPFREQTSSAGVGVNLPMQMGGWGVSAFIRYGWSYTRPTNNLDPVFDPLDRAPVFPKPRHASSVSTGIFFGSTDTYFDSISTESGWSGSVSMRFRHPRFGGELETSELFYSVRAFSPLWFRHVLALKVNGATGRGTTRRLNYALAAPPMRNALLDVLDQIQFGSSYLRGYPANAANGDRYVLATCEYRLPLVDAFSGVSTVPIFLQRLKLSVFTDLAMADTQPMRMGRTALKRSLGAELLTRGTVGWRLPVQLRIGYAKGFTDEGVHQFYVYLGRWF